MRKRYVVVETHDCGELICYYDADKYFDADDFDPKNPNNEKGLPHLWNSDQFIRCDIWFPEYIFDKDCED